ncbi:hypothetical protein V5O48_017223 [Marasmius crinis-equi]|uniref:Major facilitator superfamily MFS-1 n=1 Tax=Marasmius crinis-equi TaxID=585013 RepID=A0ABR3EPJ1_9AGAR
MTITKKNIRISIPQTFDEPDDNEQNERRHSQQCSGTGIPVFRSFSISDIWNRDGGDEEGQRARIPSIVSFSGDVYYASPLPKLSMVVLSIAMLSEFLSAGVAGSFILFMVKGFGDFQEDSEVAFWTGILVSMFFLTQFLTSLLWASLAEKYSPRTVLGFCLLGSALSTASFGASQSLLVAMVARLAQGVFAGSIGVAKSSIGTITDSSNEGRAYAILGFCWGSGGILGAVVGGTFEHPADKWPAVFESNSLFSDSPYLLPCLIAASVMITGSFLSCFLDPDLGPSTGAGALKPEKVVVPLPGAEPENDDGRRSIGSIKHLTRKLSNVFRDPFIPESDERTGLLFSRNSAAVSPTAPTFQAPPQSYSAIRSGGGGYPLDRNLTMTMDSTRTRTSRRYSDAGRRPAQEATVSGIRRRSRSNYPNNRFSRVSYADIENGQNESIIPSSPVTKRRSLVDRVVMANENAFTAGIADFWVAAAISLEGADEDDDEEGEVVEIEGENSDARSISSRPSISNPRHSRVPSRPVYGRENSDLGNYRPSSPIITRARLMDFPRTDTMESNTNLRVEPALQPIIESRRVSNFYPPVSEPAEDVEPVIEEIIEEEESAPSMDIPVLVIMQYGLLALHSTTHDQVFMSYLVTPFEGGGLNLNAGHFAQLIALMSVFQIFYQFFLYPNVGPPRGPLSYLTLFRVGCLLFIPSYLSVILYRGAFASPDGSGNSALMFGLTVSTAIRYCGGTFGYTSISILLNYMTPPHAVGYANGVAQSVVSLARCIGPVVGGWLWSYSTQDDPSGFYFGFVCCAVFCGVAILHSFMIR